MELLELATDISAKAGVALAPAFTTDIANFTALGAPKAVTDFYAQYEPKSCAEISGARLWPLVELIRENTDYVPGADLHPRGYLVVGTTECGDAFCLDLRHTSDSPSPVLLMSHEVSWEGMLDADIHALRKVVATSFVDFLALFVAGSLDQEPLYAPTAA